MPKGRQVVIAGTAYEKVRKPKTAKRKAISASGSRKRARLSGSGDYRLGKYSYKGETPFASVGRAVGSMLPFGFDKIGAPALEGIGHAVGRIFGSGDYTTGPMVRSNVLVNSTEVPQFENNGRTSIISHREYLKDIKTSSVVGAFQNEAFIIQPGNSRTFPWLSTIAQNYEQYRIHGMVFFFKSTSGESVGSVNTSLGTVVMATEYNVSSPNHGTKAHMENSEFAQSGKSSISMMHGIECATDDKPINNYFVRTGDVPGNDSVKWYDYANFQIATQGFQGTDVTVGELWVSYIVEFFKPQIPRTFGGEIPGYVREGTTVTGVQPYGSIQLSSEGPLDVTVSGTTITLNDVSPNDVFFIQLYYVGVAAAYYAPTWASSDMDPTQVMTVSASGSAPENGVVAARCQNWVTVEVKASNYTGTASMTFTGLAPPTTAQCTLFITQLDNIFD